MLTSGAVGYRQWHDFDRATKETTNFLVPLMYSTGISAPGSAGDVEGNPSIGQCSETGVS
jgi:hypothetical protein